uniref:Sialidase domain-containing protein n=1 Tax=Aquisalinus luteolus TaxID=1566827 RepID=A0A8J3A6H3_9PROT|nr:hypothetical protein GCM10011355_33780 [Aquisalinus luteolus]
MALPLLLISPFPTANAMEEASAIISKGFIYDDAPYPEAHASTIVETADGTIAASWFGGTKERNPDVAIWFATHEDGAWQTPVKVADGEQADGTFVPTWNPVLFQPADGPLTLYYKAGPTPRDWWGMQTVSHDGGQTWETPVRLPDGILGPIKNKPVQLGDGTIISPSSVENATYEGWFMHFERSGDNGDTWTSTGPIESPEGIDAIQPSILVHPDETLQALGRTRQGVVA